jgi:hypothetical protein
MKPLLTSLAAAILVLSTFNSARAADFFKVAVSGTVQTQLIVGGSSGRIRTEALNNKRFLGEFGVSPDDYRLAFDFATNALVLLPKDPTAVLPTLTILSIGSSALLTDSKAHIFKISGSVQPGVNTNLFQNLSGELTGTIHFRDAGTFTTFVFSFTGRGTDLTNGGAGPAFLKFRFTSTGRFAQ